MVHETTAATKAVKQNKHPYWKKKKKMYCIIYQSIPSLTISLLKTSPDPRRLHGKHAKENQTLFMFLTTKNLSGLPCSHECKYGVYSDLSSYTVTLAR